MTTASTAHRWLSWLSPGDTKLWVLNTVYAPPPPPSPTFGLPCRRLWARLQSDRHSGSLNNWGESAAFVNDICKWLDSQVFSGPISEPFENVHNPLGRKITHTLVLFTKSRAWVPGVVVCPLWNIMVGQLNARCYWLHQATLNWGYIHVDCIHKWQPRTYSCLCANHPH